MMNIEHLVVEYYDWLLRKARRYYANEYDAEDLASETIEKLLVSKTHFDTRKSFKPWALTVMQNTYITRYNRQMCVPFVSLDGDYTLASSYLADQELAISNILEAVRKCARKSISIECVILYAKGYNYQEIAKMLRLPVGTVMSRISNGRKMLRQALE